MYLKKDKWMLTKYELLKGITFCPRCNKSLVVQGDTYKCRCGFFLVSSLIVNKPVYWEKLNEHI